MRIFLFQGIVPAAIFFEIVELAQIIIQKNFQHVIHVFGEGE